MLSKVCEEAECYSMQLIHTYFSSNQLTETVGHNLTGRRPPAACSHQSFLGEGEDGHIRSRWTGVKWREKPGNIVSYV